MGQVEFVVLGFFEKDKLRQEDTLIGGMPGSAVRKRLGKNYWVRETDESIRDTHKPYRIFNVFTTYDGKLVTIVGGIACKRADLPGDWNARVEEMVANRLLNRR